MPRKQPAGKPGTFLKTLGTGVVHQYHLRRAVQEFPGAYLECDSSGRWCVYQIIAPDGYQWSCGSHCLRVEWRRGDSTYRDASIRDAMQRLSQEQLSKCDSDCECGGNYSQE